MARPRFRALVLSAGYGTRLRPLTYTLPKPLLPVPASPIEPVTGRTLRRLRDAGCDAAVLNLHHLAESIPAALGRSWHGLPLLYSHEEEIQGTLGALFPARDALLPTDAVVVVNGDSLCQWPFETILKHHHKTAAEITLLLLPREPDDSLGGGIGLGAGSRVAQLRDLPPMAEVHRRRIFAGVSVLAPHLLDRVEAGFGDVVAQLWQPLLELGGRIESVTTSREWHDLGTPSRYLDAVMSLLHRQRPTAWSKPPAVSTLARCSAESMISKSMIDRGVVVDPRSRVEASLILEGARLGADCRAHHSIIGPGVELPAGTEIENRMVCRAEPQHELGPTDSVLGDLIFTPL